MNLANRTSRIVLLLTLTLFAFAQSTQAQKCKLDKDEADPLTGERYLMTKQKLSLIPTLGVRVERTGDKVKFMVSFSVAGANDNPIRQGSKISLKADDGTLTELPCAANAEGTANVSNGNITTSYSPEYVIDVKALEQLAQSPINFVRIDLNGTNHDFKVGKKSGKKFNEAVRCMTE